MAINYDYYRVFFYVGKFGSFTHAAKMLCSNQPNVTRIINNLEEELSCKLFLRSKKGAQLTPEGQKLFQFIEAAFEQIAAGESIINESKELHRGNLSLAISDIALHGVVLDILQQYRKIYPGIHIRIFNHSTSEGVDAVNRGIVEFAFVTTPTEAPKNLIETRIKPFENILIAGKQFFFLTKEPNSLQKISEYPIICLSQETKSFSFYSTFFSDHNLILNPSIEAAATDQVIPMVKHDLGLGFIPADMAKEDLEKGNIFEIPLVEKIPVRYICFLRDRSRPMSAAAAALEKMIRAAM